MKIALWIFGVLFILVGIGWFLQGINVIGGSAMSGHSQWAWIGGVAALIGIGLLWLARKGRGSEKAK